MNVIFTVIFLSSTVILLFHEPQAFLAAMLSGGSAAATLCLSLIASYAFWLGVMRLWEDSGVTRAFSKLLKPVVGKVFLVQSEEAKSAISMNLAANTLGIGGAATPYGVKSVALLKNEQEERYAASMLFVLNASSLQLIPTSIVAMRVALGSSSPTDIILPTMLASLMSTLFGWLLVRWFVPSSRSVRSARSAHAVRSSHTSKIAHAKKASKTQPTSGYIAHG